MYQKLHREIFSLQFYRAALVGLYRDKTISALICTILFRQILTFPYMNVDPLFIFLQNTRNVRAERHKFHRSSFLL